MKILLIGCGKMGGAMLNGWLRAGIAEKEITVVDPFAANFGTVQIIPSLNDLPPAYKPDVVVLAVKPQNLSEILPSLRQFDSAIFISIIAGKTIGVISQAVPNSLVVRTMPNLASLIGKGVIGAVSNREISKSEAAIINQLLSAAGTVTWVENEQMINSITAITGSGPAYVFLFAQALLKSAIELGFSPEAARKIVLEMIVGSAQLALESPEQNLLELKKAVTSKGGTTAAALEVLEKDEIFQKLINNAVKAAHMRAEELAK